MRLTLLSLLLLTSKLFLGQDTLLFTDFQKGIPENYTLIDNDNLNPNEDVSEYSNAWITTTDPMNTQNMLAAATSFFNPVGKADRWLITPPLSLGSFGNYIEWQAKSQDASYGEDYLVMISTTDSAIENFKDTLAYIIQENPDWTLRKINLDKLGYANKTVYIAFRLITFDGFKLYIDDVHAWKNEPLGLPEHTPSLRVFAYPNPCQDMLFVEVSEPVDRCEIYTLNGALVAKTTTKNVPVSEMESGVYFIKVITPSGEKTIRFVKN
jgi:hypothetical protein